MKLALPNKGRLSDPAIDLLEQAGFHLDVTHERKLQAHTENGEIKVLFVRTSDIAEFVEEGVADAGVTGLDQVKEAQADVEQMLGLGFGSCRLMLAVPETTDWSGIKDVEDGVRVATSFPTITRQWFDERGIEIDLVPVSGATEITPHLGVADLVVDLVSTGSTMAANSLEPVETILDSQAVFVANRDSLADEDTGERLQEFVWVMESVLEAEDSRYLMANVPREKIDTVREMLPGLSSPTVLDLLDRDEMVAVHAVVPEDDVFGLVRGLKEVDAEGILVTPIERLVP
ncbi:ATP phosphoribosyltransferase [Thermoplasmatales archaeon SW_10_69_26]|nr:MAG: ATP phosphoribosyltransferase [Thermoplasmatales archaeon SW_10_69_26]